MLFWQKDEGSQAGELAPKTDGQWLMRARSPPGEEGFGGLVSILTPSWCRGGVGSSAGPRPGRSRPGQGRGALSPTFPLPSLHLCPVSSGPGVAPHRVPLSVGDHEIGEGRALRPTAGLSPRLTESNAVSVSCVLVTSAFACFGDAPSPRRARVLWGRSLCRTQPTRRPRSQAQDAVAGWEPGPGGAAGSRDHGACPAGARTSYLFSWQGTFPPRLALSVSCWLPGSLCAHRLGTGPSAQGQRWGVSTPGASLGLQSKPGVCSAPSSQ